MTSLEHSSENAAVSSLSQSAPDRQQARAAAQLLVAGLVSGLALHVLVWDRAGGSLGWFLSMMIFVACSVFLNLNEHREWRRRQWAWFAVMLVSVGMTVIRDALEVRLLMVFVMLLALGMMFYQSLGYSLTHATLIRVFGLALRMPLRMLGGVVGAVETLIQTRWHGLGQMQAIIRGLLLAMPLLLIFVGLFASADAVFSAWLDNLGDIMNALAPQTPLISFALTMVATGVLSCSVRKSECVDLPRAELQVRLPSLGREETAVLLGSLATLFVIFVVLQLSWLFGGQDLIQSRGGLTLAEYARRGFFELVVVAGLTLAVLMSVSAMQGHRGLLRVLGGIMIACVLVMLVSALHRLHLYIDQFGLTMDRLMALALALWLAFALLWFGGTVLRGRQKGFIVGLLLSGITISVLLALMNPAQRVAQVNIEHAQSRAQPLDVDYLISLGADAIVPLLSSAEGVKLTQEQSISVHEQLAFQTDNTDWRDWNRSRARAVQLLIDE
ncbi:DUF4153 domain-containing protein [Pseudohongiella spirulinae]|uniref:Uncharacterized protein n=1 Tax=Pseudohongiella spirulinae TaxID=1249552 RepID=A0A0S2KCY2_9GAMM|nr:DUF4173 domain-containing protein [Pseudohongiella spirulinae]ALO45826.1 hypothetical protein PS2015_1166 [Pseudohongiella spirulinae]